MYYLYILRTLNHSLYVGVTSDLDRRILRHRSGDGAEFTRRNKVESLVYIEEFETYFEVRRREKQIKGWTRIKKENLIKFGKPNARDKIDMNN